MAGVRDVEDVLRRRYWLKSNFEWFMNEVVFHKEQAEYLKNEKIVLWHTTDPEGKVNIP